MGWVLTKEERGKKMIIKSLEWFIFVFIMVIIFAGNLVQLCLDMYKGDKKKQKIIIKGLQSLIYLVALSIYSYQKGLGLNVYCFKLYVIPPLILTLIFDTIYYVTMQKSKRRPIDDILWIVNMITVSIIIVIGVLSFATIL